MAKEKRPKKHWCYRCNQLIEEEYMEYASDPYALDIRDDETKVWECEACREESAMEI